MSADQEDLCEAFHTANNPDNFWHAPVRQFYSQTLELFCEDPTPVIRLWQSLTSGHKSAGRQLVRFELPGSVLIYSVLQHADLSCAVLRALSKLASLHKHLLD